MNKTSQLKDLFDQWENSDPTYQGKFTRDGIIDESKFELPSGRKILIIAKEPNDPKHNLKDFRDWWKEELKYAFSYRIAEWAFGIQNNFPTYTSIWETPDNGFAAIQRIAFINIKKIGGAGISNLKALETFLDQGQNLENNRKEINIIQPNLIILCLSWKELRNKLFPELYDKWKDCGYEIPVAKWNDCKVIDFYHPSSRNAPAAAYSLLQNVIHSQVYQNL